MAAPSGHIGHHRWRLAAIIATAVVAVVAASLFIISRWAFGRDKIAQDLADATSGTLRFQSFRNLYFPHPGCVLRGVTVQRKGSEANPPLISIHTLTVIGSYTGLLSKHVSLIKVEGLQVTPGGIGWPASANRASVVVRRLVADDAKLQVLHDGQNKPLTFRIHHFALENLGGDGPMPFEVELTNPIPPGEISASGRLGPWNTRQPEGTPIAGSYSFRHADLGAIQGIGGVLSSNGKFSGTVRHLRVTGTTDTPEFEVTSTQHRFPLRTRFEAEVNATNGDVALPQVNAKLGETDVTLQGNVLPDPQHRRRTATLDFVVQDGRIQDILYPFVKEPRSPVNGVSSCRGRVILPAGNEPFRRKVNLNATFGIGDARFTSPNTQRRLNQASERARGHADNDHPENVISNLKGHVALKNGVARLSQFSFQVPGAFAVVHGTYNVINERIDFHGTIRLQAKISDTTTGIKSFLLKAISPFLKTKDKPREPLPVAVSGTYDHPHYSVSVTKQNQRRHGI